MLPTQFHYATHAQILGTIGSGKSTYCRFCIQEHLAQGNGLAVLDYKTLTDDIIADLCAADYRKPVWLLDLSSGESPTWNPFKVPKGASISAHAKRMASAIVSAWREDINKMPTYRRVVQAVLTLSMETGEPLQHAMEITRRENTAIRHWALGRLQDVGAKRTIREMQDAAAKNFDWNNLVGSTTNRLANLVDDPAIVRCIGLPESCIDIPRIRRNKEVLLVNIRPSDYLSADSARVFAALLTSEFLHDSLEPEERQYFLYLDEPQEFVTSDFASMLNLSRHSALRVSLMYHHPSEGLFEKDHALQDSIDTNCGIKCIFRGLPLHWAKVYGETFFLDSVNEKHVMESRIRHHAEYEIDEDERGRHAVPFVMEDYEDAFWPRDEKVGQAAARIMNVPEQQCWMKLPDKCMLYKVPFVDDWKTILDPDRLAKYREYLTVKAISPDEADEIIKTEYERFIRLTRGGERATRKTKKESVSIADEG